MMPCDHCPHFKIEGCRLSREKRHLHMMAPLQPIADWQGFELGIKRLKAIGIDGMTFDVWWHDVEPRPGEYDWAYYLKIAQSVTDAGLQFIPIFSFHACGTNVGDDVIRPLPPHVLNLAPAEEMFFKDSHGRFNHESVAPWYTPIYDHYAKVMASFVTTFESFASRVPVVFVGVGPAGELRYPSYSVTAGWKYPEPGLLQCYSNAAKRDFRDFLIAKYGSTATLNAAWNSELRSIDEVEPPLNEGDVLRGNCGRQFRADFFSWYGGVLVRHLHAMAKTADEQIRQHWTRTRLDVKVPGIHWLYDSASMPRGAEMAAGLVDYDRIVDAFRSCGLGLTFTAAEMNDVHPDDPTGSRPTTLLHEVAAIALHHHVPLSIENALPIHGSAQTLARDYFENALDLPSLRSACILRSSHYVSPEGGRLLTDQDYRFTKSLIERFKKLPICAPISGLRASHADTKKARASSSQIRGDSPSASAKKRGLFLEPSTSQSVELWQKMGLRDEFRLGSAIPSELEWRHRMKAMHPGMPVAVLGSESDLARGHSGWINAIEEIKLLAGPDTTISVMDPRLANQSRLPRHSERVVLDPRDLPMGSFVFLFTPNRTHVPLCKELALLDNVGGIYCEKPAAPRFAETLELRKLASKTKKPIIFGDHELFVMLPLYVLSGMTAPFADVCQFGGTRVDDLRAQIRAGRFAPENIAEIHGIHFELGNIGHRDGLRQRNEGGVLLDLGIHFLNGLGLLGQHVERVNAARLMVAGVDNSGVRLLPIVGESLRAEDHVVVRGTMRNRVPFELELGQFAPARKSLLSVRYRGGGRAELDRDRCRLEIFGSDGISMGTIWHDCHPYSMMLDLTFRMWKHGIEGSSFLDLQASSLRGIERIHERGFERPEGSAS